MCVVLLVGDLMMMMRNSFGLDLDLGLGLDPGLDPGRRETASRVCFDASCASIRGNCHCPNYHRTMSLMSQSQTSAWLSCATWKADHRRGHHAFVSIARKMMTMKSIGRAERVPGARGRGFWDLVQRDPMAQCQRSGANMITGYGECHVEADAPRMKRLNVPLHSRIVWLQFAWKGQPLVRTVLHELFQHATNKYMHMNEEGVSYFEL